MAPQKHIPLRSCVICGEKIAKGSLMRLVRTPAGAVEVDPTGSKAGRGAYLCQREACRQQALKRPARLERVLRVDIPGQERERLAHVLAELRE